MANHNQMKGNRMREIRRERGLTLREVAKATFYSPQAIRNAEVGASYYRTGGSLRRFDTRRDQFWETMSKFYGVPSEELRRWS